MSDKAGIKVLIVDDDANLVRSAGIYLRDAGYKVFEAYSGEQGLEQIALELPDIIILDIEMSPGISGPDVLSRIRRDPATDGVPVVFLTAKVDIEAMEATLDNEAQGYLLKPMSGGDLLDKIDEVLSESGIE
ncbi:MAG: response regulator [Candidatus Geothermincolia bacterium]